MHQRRVMVEILEKMTWHFFIAPRCQAFLTGDNPVVIDKHNGLRKNISELWFPISTDVALVACWHKELKEGFGDASPRIVRNLNRRITSNASRYLYFSDNQEWVVRLFGNSYEFRPLFPGDIIFNVI